MKKEIKKMFCRMTIVRMAVGLLLAVCPFCTMMAQSEAELEETVSSAGQPPAPATSIYDDAPDAYEKRLKPYERYNIRLSFPEADVKVFAGYLGLIIPNKSVKMYSGQMALPCGLRIDTSDACLFVQLCDRDSPWWESGRTDPGYTEVGLLYLLLENARNPDKPEVLPVGFREKDYVTIRKDKDLLAACGADSIVVLRFPNRKEIVGKVFQLPDFAHCYGVVLCKAGKYGDLSTLFFLKNEKSLNKYLKYLCNHAKFVVK